MPVTVSFLDAANATTAFKSALDWCAEVAVHVAWGTSACPLHAPLLAHAAKVKALRVGIHFLDTDPQFIEDWMAAAPGALRVVKSPTGVFHPKLYCFDLGSERRVLIGSSNFTGPAFQANAEANTLLVGPADELQLGHLSTLTAPVGQKPTPTWLKSYRARWKAAKEARKATDAKIAALSSMDNAFDLDVDLASYAATLAAAADSAGHGYEVDHWLRSLKVVRAAVDFSDPASMGREDWRIFGATPETTIVNGEPVELRFFGFIRGRQARLLLKPQTKKKLAPGLLAIPSKGAVSREAFDKFAEGFLAAGFTDSMLGTASRLLSVWRPDRFAPCNKGSRPAFRAAVQAPLKTLDDYFEAHRQLWDMPWAKAPKPPKSPLLPIWRARVALLDVLFYDVNG